MSKNSTKKTTLPTSAKDSTTGLSAQFWEKFAASVWEKGTFVERKDFVRPPISEQELFECVVEMGIKRCDARAAGVDEPDVRIYVEATEITKDFEILFPKLSDGNFSGYSKRVSKILGGQSFSFVIDEIEMPDNLKLWTHSFLRGMYGPLKKISNGHMWSIFFGDYTTTPYGVHDHTTQIYSESAFYFPIVGRKEMATWPSKYVDEHPKLKWAHDCTDHLHESTRLIAEPGGMMYWPSDRWHIGSSGGGDVSIVLAVRAFSDIYPMFLHSVMNLESLFPYKPSGISAKLGELSEAVLFLKHMALLKFSARARQNQVRDLPFDPLDLQGSAEKLPGELKELGNRPNLRRYFGENIEKVLTIFWLYHLSNLGVESRNRVSPPIAIKPELVIAKKPSAVLLWRQIKSGEIVLVAGRRVHEVPADFFPLIRCIVASKVGQSVSYKELVDSLSEASCCSKFVENEIENLLKFLGEAAVFTSS